MKWADPPAAAVGSSTTPTPFSDSVASPTLVNVSVSVGLAAAFSTALKTINDCDTDSAAENSRRPSSPSTPNEPTAVFRIDFRTWFSPEARDASRRALGPGEHTLERP